MPASKSLATLRDEIYQQKLRVAEIEDDYITALYLETMPDVGPLYKYCYQTSNLKIPGHYYSVEHWLRAVQIHMSRRLPGHGGGVTKALIISVPPSTSQEKKDAWIDYTTKKLRRAVRVVKPRIDK
jgi:hypothetical protein